LGRIEKLEERIAKLERSGNFSRSKKKTSNFISGVEEYAKAEIPAWKPDAK